MPDQQPRTRRQFTPEFKRDAVELVRTSGRPIAELARELGTYDPTLGNWVRQDRTDRGEREGLSSDEQARLRELERDNARLRMERDLPKRTVAFWSRRPRRREPLPLRRCPEGGRLPGSRRLQGRRVTRSASDAWTARTFQGPSVAEREEAGLVAEVRRTHARSKGTYGAPRTTVELRRRGWAVNHKRVERLVRAHSNRRLPTPPAPQPTKPDAGAAPAPDLLGRLFDPDQVDVAWCGDVTWIPTDEGWPYLAR